MSVTHAGLRAQTAIVGVGETTYYKRGRSPVSEFELAVSASTSVAVRAAQDGFEVAFACGDDVTVTSEVSALLALACRFTWGSSDLQHTCARVSGGMGGSSLVANYVLLALLVRISDSTARSLYEVADEPGVLDRLRIRRMGA